MTSASIDEVRVALAFVSPHLPRDEWARVGMALKDFDDGERGFDLFDNWSQGGETYSAKATRDTWKSIKAGGAVSIGTLFHLAKAAGYAAPAKGMPVRPTRAQLAAEQAAKQERAAKREADAQRYRDRADEAARGAEAAWSSASDTGISPYLQRKGVKGWGVRYLADGTLLVPMRDAAGKLQNVQRIAPRKPAGKLPEKRYNTGGRKTGLWHWCGDPAGAAALIVAEGLATASSIHEAASWPVAVAFDAGNLVHVAKELRALHPDALIVIAADNDTETELATGRNPGIEAATKAARAVGGVLVAPPAEALPAGGSDMNDLAAHAGLDSVRALIEAAVTAGPQSLPKRSARP